MNPAQKRSYQDNARSNRSELKKFRIYDEISGEIFVHPHSMYDGCFPNFKEPVEIGTFISKKRKFDLETKQILNRNKKGYKYLVLPEDCSNCKFDLKLGFSKFVPHIPHQHGIDTLLEWVLENKNQLMMNSNNLSLKPFKVDFICWRGLVSTLANIPYERFKDCMFGVILYKGTFYMCEIETAAQKHERENMDEKGQHFSYWGHKFETYITADLPDEKPNSTDQDEAPDPENNFSSVISTSLGGHNMLYAAEIDCCVSAQHTGLRNYSEIKTSQGHSIQDLNRNIHRNFKFLKWWIQSFLVNIQFIKVGLRDDAGLVSKIVDFDISQIAKQSQNKNWKETVCFNFLKTVLDFIRTFCVLEKELYIVYRERQSNSIKIRREEKNSDFFKNHYFLREWFTNII